MVLDEDGALRRALEAGDFEAVQPLVLQFATALRSELSLAVTLDERRVALRNALETVNAHLRLARAMRSHIFTRLEALAGHSFYQASRQGHAHLAPGWLNFATLLAFAPPLASVFRRTPQRKPNKTGLFRLARHLLN